MKHWLIGVSIYLLFAFICKKYRYIQYYVCIDIYIYIVNDIYYFHSWLQMTCLKVWFGKKNLWDEWTVPRNQSSLETRCFFVCSTTQMQRGYLRTGFCYVGVSKNSVTPQIIHFNRVFHYKPSIWGHPYFWKYPCTWCYSSSFCHGNERHPSFVQQRGKMGCGISENDSHLMLNLFKLRLNIL